MAAVEVIRKRQLAERLSAKTGAADIRRPPGLSLGGRFSPRATWAFVKLAEEKTLARTTRSTPRHEGSNHICYFA